jgi:hypothetical protein
MKEVSMILAAIILNVLFAVLVVGGMLALHGWAIATDAGRRLHEPRIRRAPKAAPVQWQRARVDLATH